MEGVGKEERKNKLSCRPLYEIVCLLMEYNDIVSSQIRKYKMDSLKAFAHGRMVQHFDYFDGNQVIRTALLFLQKMIDNFG